MPLFNWLFCKARYVRKKFIIDIPPMPKETQEKIAQTILDFASKTISDSVAKMGSEAITKIGKDKFNA
jgi:hypothetical protein